MTTKAWTFTHRGAPSSVLTLTTTHPAPAFPPPLPLPRAAAQPEEWVLVRPSHAALNPAGLFHMALVPRLFRAATAVPELDFTGTVADVWAPSAPSPPSSSSPSPPPPRFRPGDAVVASLPVAFLWPQGQGALQGLVACPARYCLRRPPGVPPAQAAGLPVAGCTAAQMVEDAGLGRGHRVLVYGASGGVGSLALQLARLAVGEEGTVVAVCSGRNMEMVKGLGADEVSVSVLCFPGCHPFGFCPKPLHRCWTTSTTSLCLPNCVGALATRPSTWSSTAWGYRAFTSTAGTS